MNGIKLSLERQSLECAIIRASNEWFTLTEVRRHICSRRDVCPPCYAINASPREGRSCLLNGQAEAASLLDLLHHAWCMYLPFTCELLAIGDSCVKSTAWMLIRGNLFFLNLAAIILLDNAASRPVFWGEGVTNSHHLRPIPLRWARRNTRCAVPGTGDTPVSVSSVSQLSP